MVNGPHVIMLSHRLWQRRFAGDPGIVGKTIQIDGVAHEVVGVLPRDFRLQLPTEAFEVTDGDMWTPIQFDYGQPLPRNLTFFTVFGRLAPGVTFEQAQGEMDRIAEQFRAEFKEHAASNVRIRAVPLHYDVVKHARPALLVLLGAVGMVLLIACANVAEPAAGARHDAAGGVRPPHGAGREPRRDDPSGAHREPAARPGGRRARAWSSPLAAMAVLRSLHPANLPRLSDVQLDGTVLAFTAAVCAADRGAVRPRAGAAGGADRPAGASQGGSAERHRRRPASRPQPAHHGAKWRSRSCCSWARDS